MAAAFLNRLMFNVSELLIKVPTCGLSSFQTGPSIPLSCPLVPLPSGWMELVLFSLWLQVAVANSGPLHFGETACCRKADQ